MCGLASMLIHLESFQNLPQARLLITTLHGSVSDRISKELIFFCSYISLDLVVEQEVVKLGRGAPW